MDSPQTSDAVIECFRKSPSEGLKDVERDDETDVELGEGGGSGRRLACKLCHSVITRRGDAIDKDGKHQHTFFNPSGILFDVGCFARAPGCSISGTPTSEFSWFKGFLWQYSSCSVCNAHLGWFFSGGGPSFYGLIVNRLIEVEEAEED
jgi:hypothetical protein